MMRAHNGKSWRRFWGWLNSRARKAEPAASRSLLIEPLEQRQLLAFAPTDISLGNGLFAENQPIGAVVGAFSTTDADPGDTFTYSLVDGDGDTNNSAFSIDANGQLLTAADFDYETKSAYSIRVCTTDQDALSYEEAFSLTVTDANEAPALDGINPLRSLNRNPADKSRDVGV